ncbi:hypothetical protein EDB19DRAFT_1093912 [Suillus lakei]|nr:hypothetical protein EDB19DRAFT_1093912 [Suillus lakei]
MLEAVTLARLPNRPMRIPTHTMYNTLRRVRILHIPPGYQGDIGEHPHSHGSPQPQTININMPPQQAPLSQVDMGDQPVQMQQPLQYPPQFVPPPPGALMTGSGQPLIVHPPAVGPGVFMHPRTRSSRSRSRSPEIPREDVVVIHGSPRHGSPRHPVVLTAPAAENVGRSPPRHEQIFVTPSAGGPEVIRVPGSVGHVSRSRSRSRSPRRRYRDRYPYDDPYYRRGRHPDSPDYYPRHRDDRRRRSYSPDYPPHRRPYYDDYYPEGRRRRRPSHDDHSRSSSPRRRGERHRDDDHRHHPRRHPDSRSPTRSEEGDPGRSRRRDDHTPHRRHSRDEDAPHSRRPSYDEGDRSRPHRTGSHRTGSHRTPTRFSEADAPHIHTISHGIPGSPRSHTQPTVIRIDQPEQTHPESHSGRPVTITPGVHLPEQRPMSPDVYIPTIHSEGGRSHRRTPSAIEYDDGRPHRRTPSAIEYDDGRLHQRTLQQWNMMMDGYTVEPLQQWNTTMDGHTIEPLQQWNTTMDGHTIEPLQQWNTTMDGHTIDQLLQWMMILDGYIVDRLLQGMTKPTPWTSWRFANSR